MRQAHPLSLTAVLLVMAIASPLAVAQDTEASPPATPSQTENNRVFNPSAPTLALQHRPLPTSGAIVAQPSDWKAANAAVAEFPRGHGDVLKWEKAQNAGPGKAANQAPATHHQHGTQP